MNDIKITSTNILSDLWKSFIGEHISLNVNADNISFDEVERFFENINIFKYTSFESYSSDENNVSFLYLLNRFLKNLKDDEFGTKIVADSLRFGCVKLYLEYDAAVSKCNESFNALNTNVLKFDSESGNVFIFQHVGSCDAIYIPKLKLLKIYKHVSMENLYRIISAFFYEYCNGYCSTKKKFGGTIVSHGRPYHYYYDNALSVRKVFISGMLEMIPEYIQLKGADFISISDVYDIKGINRDKVLDSNNLNKYCLDNSLFFIHLGLHFDKDKHLELIRGCDAKLIHKSKQIINDDIENICSVLKSKDFILWLGITGQKRAWIEQVEAAVKLINEIYNINNNIAIVLDGWTSPLNPTSLDFEESRKDNEVIGELIESIPADIYTASVVGRDTLTKLRIAQEVDFFIANQSTGSLHVCRMARVPGITHISKDLYEESIKVQILDTAIKYPIEKVNDIKDPDNLRIDFTSYSISSEDFLKFSLPYIKSYISVKK